MTQIPPFHILADLTQPCPHCGVPACGKEAYLWTERPGKNLLAIMFDGSLFDTMGEDFFSLHITSLVYADLPEFMKEWNECEGWNEFGDYESRRIVTKNFRIL